MSDEINKASNVDEVAANLAKNLELLNLLQLKKFVDSFQETYFRRLGITAPVATVRQAKVETAVPVEEKTEYTINLVNAGPNKIQLIKEIRTITGIGLKDAKDLAESAPKDVKAGVSKDDADKIKSVLEAAGATVEVV